MGLSGSFISGEDQNIGNRPLTAEELRRESQRLAALAEQRNINPDEELNKLFGNSNISTKSNFVK